MALDEIALREVENYIEKIEKQTEVSVADQQKPSQGTPTAQATSVPTDMGQVVSAQMATTTKPNIVLPLNKQQIEEGLHRKVIEGVKWLAEWCVMMIKKYPGRVFYSSPQQT